MAFSENSNSLKEQNLSIGYLLKPFKEGGNGFAFYQEINFRDLQDKKYEYFNQSTQIFDDGVYYTYFVYEVMTTEKIQNDKGTN